MLLKEDSKKYIANAVTSMIATSLSSVDQRSALLHTWTTEPNPWNSNHFQIFIEYIAQKNHEKMEKRPLRLHNKVIVWSVSMEKVQQINTVLNMHNGWRKARDVMLR